jgi:hypothetical protein
MNDYGLSVRKSGNRTKERGEKERTCREMSEDFCVLEKSKKKIT